MTTLNPDFRGSDEVELPSNWADLTGWTDGNEDEKEAIYREREGIDKLQSDFPVAFKTRAPIQQNTQMLELWNQFQRSKGRYEGSADWSLLDEFVLKKPILWLPQLIGSCVWSNTFRGYHIRQMYQIVLLGEAQEYLGKKEFTTESFASYGPQSYGMARKRANMRGGDGLYCAPMAESLMKDGVLPCSTPKLIELTRNLGVSGEKDYPEPQGSDGKNVYRQFGNWKHIESVRQYCDYRVLESPKVTSASQLWDLLGDCKPAFVCSMEAIHKVGTHRDGFAIHARNPRDRWAHNMCFHGRFIASDGERFIRESNESWGAKHIYNRRFEEVDRAFRNGGLTVQAIGEIDGPGSSAPMVGV